MNRSYTGRFAPSPTGPLHAGSLVAALASWLDARAQGGRWLVRIEDVDGPRCVPGADRHLLQQLADCGLHPDEPPQWQSSRGAAYQEALDRLVAQDLSYPCACSRKDIEQALAASGQERPRHGELVYPGTCRPGLQGRTARAWRFLTEPAAPTTDPAAPTPAMSPPATGTSPGTVRWTDRRLGRQQQDVAREVGDFVLRRADGLWAYQLAVVVDDAAQQVTDVVRGEDLADNTARQILLQRALGLPTPRYLHTPLVLAEDGQKLSKQTGAQALNTRDPLACLQAAGAALGLPAAATANARTLAEWLSAAVPAWAATIRA